MSDSRLLPAELPSRRAAGGAQFGLGLVLLGGCILASGGLAFEQLGWVDLPGCGPASRCAAALAGPWGSLAGWPTSFIGLAFFVAVLVDWIRTFPGRSAVALRWLVRSGALVSVVFLAGIPFSGGLSAWFLWIHCSNLAFWILVERGGRPGGSSFASVVTVCALFALVSSLLTAVVAEQRRVRLATADPTEGGEAVATRRPAVPGPGGGGVVPRRGDGTARPPLARPPTAADEEAVDRQTGVVTPLTRSAEHRPYRLGSADATLQMVVFFDYQSALCRRLAPQLRQLVGLQGDKVAVTLRHFPLCADCNHAVVATRHPNACRAARAVETAGLLGGAAGFWQMHHWMLTQRGRFTDAQLKAALDRLGHDDAEVFMDTMNGPEPLRAILADVVEAQTKDVRSVPTIVANKLKVAGQQAEIVVMKALTTARQDVSQSQADKVSPAKHAAQIALPEGFTRATVAAAIAATVRLADDRDRPVGSGVVVGVRQPFVYVLTARHVVPRSGSLRVTGQALAAAAGGDSQAPVAAVVARCQFADLALLRFSRDRSADAILPICPLRLVRDEWSFAALSVGCDRGPPTTRTETVLARKVVRIREGSPAMSVWEVQGDLAAGRSGGPLVDRSGYLLGVATGTAGGKGYFTDIGAIHRFLNEQGLAWLHEAKDGM